MKAKTICGAATTLLALAAALAPSASATNSKPELQAVMRDLLAWWPGEYDTLPQVELERQLGAPPDGEHDRQYRVFARVSVPQIGENVIYGEVRTGGKNGPLIKGQQVLYVVTLDEQHQAVNVSGRRIKDGASYEQAYLYPEKLKTIAIDPAYGGNCDFRFRRYGGQLRGWLANVGQGGTSCTMVSKTSAQTMTWEADWAITPDEIWVFDNGYMKDPAHPEQQGRLFAGREDLVPERLYKARNFRCSVQPAGSQAGVANPLVVHDRGGEIDLSAAGITGGMAQLLRLPQPAPAPAFLADVLTLSVFGADRSTPLARATAEAAAPGIALSWKQGKISCSRST